MKQNPARDQGRKAPLDPRSGDFSRSVDQRIDAIRAHRERLADAARVLSERLPVERNEIVLLEILETFADLTPDASTLATIAHLAAVHPAALVRALAVRTLSRHVDPKVFEFLMTRLVSEKHGRVRLELFLGLYRIGLRGFFGHITALLLTADYQTQCAAINGLLELELGADGEVLARALLELRGRRIPPAVRITIKRALGVLRGDGCR